MNKINWKVRFKNPAFWLTAAPAAASFIYMILGLFDIVPSISESEVVNIITTAINALCVLGILVDPTTTGVTDSTRALGYTAPNDD